MADIDWPSTLPDPNIQFNTTAGFNNQRLLMDSNRVRQYPQFTTGLERVKIRWQMNQDQLRIFKDFYLNVLNQGVEWFNLNIPNPDGFTLTNTEVRFLGRYTEQILSYNNWSVNADIEYQEASILPPGSFSLVTNPDGSIQWPEDLLGFPSSINIEFDPANIVSNIETARVNQRRRYTQRTEIARLTYDFDQDQYAIFRYLFQEDIALGNDWFTMRIWFPDIENVVLARVRFITDYSARYVHIDNWDVQVSIEYEILGNEVDIEGNWSLIGSSTRNYKYTHCTDSVTYPDIILLILNPVSVIEVSGQCYSFVGLTNEDATVPAPVITDSFGSCNQCLGLIYENWLSCIDNSFVASLNTSHTDVDYAWLCVGGSYVRAYNSGLTGTLPTDPTVLKQCGTIPTSCSDLVGWEASDNFGGVGCNSGSVGDDNWNIRWDTSGSVTHSGSNIRVSSVGGVANEAACTNNATYSGSFTCDVDFNIIQLGGATQGFGSSDLILKIGSTTYRIRSTYSPAVGYEISFRQDGGLDEMITVTVTSGKFRLERIGNTLSAYYDAGSGFVQAGTGRSVSGSLDNPRCVSRTDSSAGDFGGSQITDFDNFILVDGNSEPIYIDPTGDSCS